MRLTLAGAGTAVVCAGLVGAGAVLRYPELVDLGGAGLAAVVVSAVLALRRPAITVTVGFATTDVVDGDRPELCVTLTNRRAVRCFVTVLRLVVGTEPVRIELSAVPAKATVDRGARLSPARRGTYHTSAATVGYRDPFDFAQSRHVVGESADLVVFPRTVVVAAMPPAGPRDLDGKPRVNASAGGDAFYSLREYVPGDDWRKIHWPTSARLDTMMVRHTVVPEETLHLVVLDVSEDAYPHPSTGDDRNEQFEEAVRIAASVAQATVRAGNSLLALAGGRSEVERPDSDDRNGPALALLAAVATSPAAPLPRSSLVPAGASMLFVTGRATPEGAEWLAEAARHATATFLVQVIPGGQRAADPPPGAYSLVATGVEEFRDLWRDWAGHE